MSLAHEGRTAREPFAAAVQWLAARDWAAWAAFGLPLALYLATAPPTFYGLDSAELATAVATRGIVRATGYPLYLLVGQAWLALLPPIGDVGFRLNLLSAVAAALAIFFSDRILRRLGASLWPRVGALGLLACTPAFWSMAIVAEVYTLHVALMAATLLLLMRWAEAPTFARLLAPALLAGLSLGNHASTILLLPGYLRARPSIHGAARRAVTRAASKELQKGNRRERRERRGDFEPVASRKGHRGSFNKEASSVA